VRRCVAALAVAALLALAGCRGIFLRGTVSEHGPNDVSVGVPF
jgi:hypothetical protein